MGVIDSPRVSLTIVLPTLVARLPGDLFGFPSLLETQFLHCHVLIGWHGMFSQESNYLRVLRE